MRKELLILVLVTLSITFVIGLPVQKQKKEEPSKEQTTDDLKSVLAYEKYLTEIVEALESDPEFRKKLDKAPEADIRNGKIAQELEYVSHHVRSKLDEIKRKELDRLRQLASKQFELTNDIDRNHLKVPDHLDHKNAHTFEIEDLRKLISETSKDLAEADRKRREEFKQYEMQKEFEKQSVIHELGDDDKKKYEEDLQNQKDKHNNHEKVHHPGNKAQLEEVWENQDHMEKEEFNPQTFFMIHDVDGNGFWDETELKALFVGELNKVYQPGMDEDDMKERAEEMERMREHVFQESDTNHDGLISYQEFLDQTKREEFQRDPEWETVDKVPQFTHEEYLEFERKRQAEVQRMISQGLLPPHPNMPQGYYPKPDQQYLSNNQYIDNNNKQNLHPMELNPKQIYQNFEEHEQRQQAPQLAQQQMPQPVPNYGSQYPQQNPHAQYQPPQQNQQYQPVQQNPQYQPSQQNPQYQTVQQNPQVQYQPLQPNRNGQPPQQVPQHNPQQVPQQAPLQRPQQMPQQIPQQIQPGLNQQPHQAQQQQQNQQNNQVVGTQNQKPDNSHPTQNEIH